MSPALQRADLHWSIQNGAEFKLFVIEYPSSDAASSAFKAYSDHLGKEAELLPTDGTTSETFRTGDKLTFIDIENQNLWGFWDVKKLETLESILQNTLPFPR